MALQLKTGFVGLVTNVAETQTPPGALIEAENVVIRRAGCVEPRDGVDLLQTTTGVAAYGVSYESKDIYQQVTAGSFSWHSTDGDTYQYADLLLGTVNPQPLRRDVLTTTLSRGNLYVPYEAGVLKLDDEAGPFRMAGLPLYASFTTAFSFAGASWLPNNEQVGYRLVCTRTDANGMIVRSIPSGAVTVANTSGGARGVLLVITSTNPSLFDTVEVYRTRNFATTAAVDDEMQLVAVLPSNTTGHLDVTDVASRGVTLYTSPSRGGIVQQNERPPACACVASFKGSVFYGNVRGPHRLKLSFTFQAGLTTATGVGTRIYTGDTTNTSTSLTNLSSTLGIQQGQYVSGTGIPALARVTNVVGTTVTISAAATATNVGTTLTFTDTLQVGGIDLDLNSDDFTFPAFLAAVGVQAYKITPPEGGSADTWVLETISRDSTGFNALMTHGSELTPAIAEHGATPTEATQDVWPGGLYWSKPDEPEHVAPGQYVFVGDQKKAILGLVPTRDALFILKEDGIWRLTGTNGTWRIDPFDPTTRCVLPTSVKSLNGKAYFLGNKGVTRVSDEGVELVSGPINDQVKPLIDTVLAGWRSLGRYELTDVIGSTAATFERENEYTLMRGRTESMLVYNENTGAWTKWSFERAASESIAYRALLQFDRAGRVVYALSQALYATVLGTDTALGTIEDTARYDRQTAVTVTDYAAGVATLSVARTVLVDDAIQDAAGAMWRVTAAGAALTSVSVASIDGEGSSSFTTGDCILYRTQRCTVTPAGFAEPGTSQKRGRTITAAFTKLVGPIALRYAYESNISPTYATEDVRAKYTLGRLQYPSGFSAPGTVPHAHARHWLLHGSVRWALAHGDARLEAMFANTDSMAADSPQQVAP